MEVLTALENNKVSYVIIDEVQKVPQLLDEIHSLIESSVDCTFILSGSSARKLKRSHANMLGGRAYTYHLFPFSYSEIKTGFDFQKALKFGMLPSVYLAENDFDRKEILRSYVDTYINEEVKLEAQLRNVGNFLRFLPIAASENGGLVNYSNIARESGIKSLAVKNYYQILVDTLLGFHLLPYGKSVRKRMGKHPKFYFFDTGVVTALTKKLNISFENFSSDYGVKFEHFLICEIIKLNEYKRLDLTLSFYRTERGAEVDCVIETPAGNTIAIEIKSTSTPSPAHCRGLRSLKECIPDARLFLACQAPMAVKIGDVLAIPWQELLEWVSLNLSNGSSKTVY
jgi:predicted AAA+ superfamily ATPase